MRGDGNYREWVVRDQEVTRAEEQSCRAAAGKHGRRSQISLNGAFHGSSVSMRAASRGPQTRLPPPP